jgi:aryl-alcohol dehydrogenase-like predicted oxidoreductase
MSRTMRELSPEDWEFHKRTGMPVIPYSPTAQGYFATNGERGKAYDRPENRERLAKVNAMAKKLGATLNQVALAWLLAQPFPVIPILGTTKIDHLLDGLGAADIEVDLADL